MLITCAWKHRHIYLLPAHGDYCTCTQTARGIVSHDLQDASLASLAVPGKRFVGSEVVEGVMPSPALLAEVLEAADAATEEWPRVPVARVTDAIFQVWLYLNLIIEVELVWDGRLKR